MPKESLFPHPEATREGTSIPVTSDADILSARQLGRSFAEHLGFPSCELTLISTALSELARSIVHFREHGEIILKLTCAPNGKPCMLVVARDARPPLGDFRPAMPGRFPISDSSEAGLLEAIRHAEEFEISIDDDQTAVLVVKKWKA